VHFEFDAEYGKQAPMPGAGQARAIEPLAGEPDPQGHDQAEQQQDDDLRAAPERAQRAPHAAYRAELSAVLWPRKWRA